jgi:glycerol uptake facilitator-like aquaporin
VSIANLRALGAEFVGSALLAAIVVGSGIAAASLSRDVGLQLLENAFATALGLSVLIAIFQPVSGAHFNPAVTLVDAALDRKRWRTAALYVPTQVLGCIGGAMLANLMFGLPAARWSTTDRASAPTLLAEAVATAGLILVIFALARTGRGAAAAPVVGAYIGAAYWFTSSTSFANPAITVGRMFSDTFAGIAPSSSLPFIAAQLIGAAAGLTLVVMLTPVPSANEGRADAGAGEPALRASGGA